MFIARSWKANWGKPGADNRGKKKTGGNKWAVWAAILGEIGREYGGVLFGSDSYE